ncbi:MAG: type II toxin-antitoxin system RatA family toxin [Piscinibacter sp.]|uniref:type II toxin-antitoxin system RatA family toxin n=1 Tax=Piscinibacter sp. TaxID=1903157 RepID=UPI003D0FE1AD
MRVRRSALVERSAEQLFDLIEAAEHYPRFLPWCAGATILARDDALVSAELRVRLAGTQFEMRTRNPKRRPEWMAIHLESGPFHRFEGEWQLAPLGADACRVAFTLDYEFRHGFVTRAAAPVFDRIADSMVDAFVRQAEAMPPYPPVPVSGSSSPP